jgi:hypothetical protein
VRSAEENAREFGALSRQGKDVRLALLVACSVEKDQGRGNRLDRAESKVSATAFAREAGTSKDRIVRHLEAWERLFELELVRPAQDLVPADAEGYDVSEAAVAAFSGVYDARQTKGLPAAPAVGEALRKPETRSSLLAGMSNEERGALAAEAIGGSAQRAEMAMAASPKANKAMRKAADEEEARQHQARSARGRSNASHAQATTIAQRFWSITGQMTEWARALMWLRENRAHLEALTPWQRKEILDGLVHLREQVELTEQFFSGEEEDILEGRESAPRRELSA